MASAHGRSWRNCSTRGPASQFVRFRSRAPSPRRQKRGIDGLVDCKVSTRPACARRAFHLPGPPDTTLAVVLPATHRLGSAGGAGGCAVRCARATTASRTPRPSHTLAVVRLSSSGGPPVRILLPADEVIARAAAISGGRVGAPPPPRELRVSSSIWRASCIPGKRPGCRLCRTRPELTLAPCPPCP